MSLLSVVAPLASPGLGPLLLSLVVRHTLLARMSQVLLVLALKRSTRGILGVLAKACVELDGKLEDEGPYISPLIWSCTYLILFAIYI